MSPQRRVVSDSIRDETYPSSTQSIATQDLGRPQLGESQLHATGISRSRHTDSHPSRKHERHCKMRSTRHRESAPVFGRADSTDPPSTANNNEKLACVPCRFFYLHLSAREDEMGRSPATSLLKSSWFEYMCKIIILVKWVT